MNFRQKVSFWMRRGFDQNQATSLALGNNPDGGTPGAPPRAQTVSPIAATPPPTVASLPTPIQAPDAVYLRPSDAPGVKRKKSRRERLGITNRGVSSFSFRSQPMGGVQGASSPLGT